jgi:hypothetical protein
MIIFFFIHFSLHLIFSESYDGQFPKPADSLLICMCTIMGKLIVIVARVVFFLSFQSRLHESTVAD